MNTVPFYKRISFSLMLTVLVLITLISATSMLISYYVTSQKIERDMENEFHNTERMIDTLLDFYGQHAQLSAEAVAMDILLQQQLDDNDLQAVVTSFRTVHPGSGVDILTLFDQSGRILAGTGTEQEKILIPSVWNQTQADLQFGKNSYSIFYAETENSDSFILAAVKSVVVPGRGRSYVVSGYVLDNTFLKSLPVHDHMDLSLVHGSRLVATTLPSSESFSELIPDRLARSRNQLEKISFLNRDMFVKALPLPGLIKSKADLILFSHPVKSMLTNKNQLGQHFLIIFSVGFICTLILLYFVIGSILNPINRLKKLVADISQGNLNERITSKVSNEFTPLIDQFNNMLDLVQQKEENRLASVVGKIGALRQQNVFIDNLLCSTETMGIVATDLDLRITYCNPLAERFFGYSQQEVIGHKLEELQPDLETGKNKKMKRIMAGVAEGPPHTFTIDRKQDSIDYSLEVTISPVKDKNGSVNGFMLMARDITESNRMDNRLHAALAELQVILDNTMLGLVLVRGDQIMRVNSTFETLFGHTMEEIKGVAWSELRSVIFAGENSKCWDGSGRMSSLLRKRDGKTGEQQLFWGKVHKVAIDSQDKSVIYFFEDMSSKKEMFEKIQRLGQAVEQSSNSIVIANIDGIIEYVNRSFCRITGYTSAEVVGRKPSMLSSGKTPPETYREMWAALSRGQEWTGEFVNRKKSGEEYEERVVISPIRNERNQITHYVATKENVTDLKQARQLAESANQAKSEFLANMSHEIRTPMNSIIGMTELLLDPELTSNREEYLANVNSSATVLLSVINDILDYSKIDAGKLDLVNSPFDPGQLIEEVIATLQILARQKEINLSSTVSVNSDSDAPCFLKGDGLRIRQVMLNLAGNAVKFTRQGSVTIELTVKPVDTGHCSLDFAVRDTGIGISPSQQEVIFADFTQADNSITRDFGGTGLGLAISNRLLGLMDSAITLESSLGKGSVFSFSLLLEKSTEPPVACQTSEQDVDVEISPLRILLVEDHPANQQLAVIILTKQGHTVTVADNGLEALSCLSNENFDLIFMDMQMPVMEGLTTTRFIRKYEQGQVVDLEKLKPFSGQLQQRLAGGHLHIIAVTANAMEEDRQRCLAAGMDDYLSKPYRKATLLNILQKFVGNSMVEPGKENSSADQVKTASVSRQAVRQHLMETFELDETEVEDILKVYAQSLQENLNQLQLVMKEQDGVSAGRQAHSLKGALLTLGLDDAAATAFILEKELPVAIQGRHRQLVVRLESELKSITPDIVNGS